MPGTLQSLIRQTGPRSGLQWLTPEPSEPAVIVVSEPPLSHQSLIGPLNCIHPNRLQVIGHAELVYLTDLGPMARQSTCSSPASRRR